MEQVHFPLWLEQTGIHSQRHRMPLIQLFQLDPYQKAGSDSPVSDYRIGLFEMVTEKLNQIDTAHPFLGF